MAETTIKYSDLKNFTLTSRVAVLRDEYFAAQPEICTERANLVTQFSLDKELLEKDGITSLDKALTYRYVLENRKPVIDHSLGYKRSGKNWIELRLRGKQLFAGSTTSKFKGVPLYPELTGLAIWPELWTVSKRTKNPYKLHKDDVEILNKKVFPHWMEKNILEIARAGCFEKNKDKGHGPKYAPEIKLLEQLVFFMASKPVCISHTIPDFSQAVNRGLRSLIDEVRGKGEEASDPQKKDFYSAMAEAIEGIIAYSKKLGVAAQDMAKIEKDPARRAELEKIAEIHRNVPEQAAGSFYEGLATIWVCWIACHLENANVGLSLGRLDQVLHDLYRKDVDNKVITVDEAVELVCCLWLKIGDHVPMMPEAGEQLFGGTGSNQAITIGGIDMDGNDAVNDLTYVMLKATELMQLRDPNLNARYHAGINDRDNDNDDYLSSLCEVNIKTGATPALHNDVAVLKALRKRRAKEMDKGLDGGIPPYDEKWENDYGVIGCVEPGSNGRFYGHSGALLINLPAALEFTLFRGKHRHTGIDEEGEQISKIVTPDPANIPYFNAFRNEFLKQAEWLINTAIDLNNIFGEAHQNYYPTPILSSLFDGPMDSGMDLIYGGARINSSGVAIIGLADTVDCLAAIEEVVYKKRETNFNELSEAMNCNFEDKKNQTRDDEFKGLLEKLRNAPKYGNEDPPAQDNAIWIARNIDEICLGRKNYRHGRYRVGYWSMTSHAGFGMLTKALPNGRKAGENFASGITPESDLTPRLSATLNSVAQLDAEFSANGMAFNLKYIPSPGENSGKKNDVDPDFLKKFVDYTKGYFEKGGMEIQFNVIDYQKLVDNFINAPQEMLVRVSGYTAYFKDLNDQMKKEIIDRTEYNLSTGEYRHHDPFVIPKQKRGNRHGL